LEDLVTAVDLTSFRRKRIVITGDTGFKGSWLSLWLHQLGADVVGFALPPQQKYDHFNLLNLGSLIHHINGDIRDPAALTRLIRGHRPDFLFHLAAQPLVKLSYQEPKRTFDTNVAGSVNVLENVREARFVKAVIYVTSDKCYLNRELKRGYREEDQLGGRDPYSASKAAAEMVFAAYYHSYFKNRARFGIASVRAGNVIGGGDWSKDRIVPDIVRALQRGKPVVLRHPGATRPWQHVLDPLSGYLRLAFHLSQSGNRYGGSYNFGPDERSIRTVRDLTEHFIRDWGHGKTRLDTHRAGVHEAQLLQLNSQKARVRLGWRPYLDFPHAVAQTAAWYKSVQAGIPALTVSRNQIDQYMERI
jgi:CDP-glucose 4,6-dehydratase